MYVDITISIAVFRATIYTLGDIRMRAVRPTYYMRSTYLIVSRTYISACKERRKGATIPPDMRHSGRESHIPQTRAHTHTHYYAVSVVGSAVVVARRARQTIHRRLTSLYPSTTPAAASRRKTTQRCHNQNISLRWALCYYRRP